MKASPHFKPLPLDGYNTRIDELEPPFKKDFMRGSVILHGIQFKLGAEDDKNIIFLERGSVSLAPKPFSTRYLVFVHACETTPQEPGTDGTIKHLTGNPVLGEEICEYIIKYTDGQEISIPIRSRYEINDISPGWGNNAFASVPGSRYRAIPTVTDDIYAKPRRTPEVSWGQSQTRVAGFDNNPVHWLFAWENPYPETDIIDIKVSHKSGKLYLLGLTAGDINENPLRYGRRQKTVLKLEKGIIDIDLGQIISVIPRPVYDNSGWENGYNNKQPVLSENEYIVEFTAHRDAIFYLGEAKAPLPLTDLEKSETVTLLPAELSVLLRVLDPDGKPTPVKVHAAKQITRQVRA